MKYEYNLQNPDFRVDNIGIVNVSRDKNYRHSYRAGRLKNGFIYVVRGGTENIFFDCEPDVIKTSPGDLIFVPKGTSYVTTYLEDGTELKIIQFDLLSGSLPEYLSRPTKLELPNARELMDEFFEPKADHPLYSLSKLYALLWQLESKHSGIPSKYKRLKPALGEISVNYAKSPPISYYAGLCDMSEVNFRRIFREYLGISPIEHRNGIRLERARTMLQSGEYNVSEACEAAGFSNLSFFIRLYRKKFGYTPKKE